MGCDTVGFSMQYKAIILKTNSIVLLGLLTYNRQNSFLESNY